MHSLQDAGFIPYSNAGADTFLDAVDGNHTVFSPDLLELDEDNEENDFNKEK